MASNTKVTLAWPLERDGVKHRADTTISVPQDEAAELLRSGRARTTDSAPGESAPDTAAPASVTAAAKGK